LNETQKWATNKKRLRTTVLENRITYGREIVSLMRWPWLEALGKLKNPMTSLGIKSLHLLVCSILPQKTALLYATQITSSF
jgi:hypothetical protein